MIAKLTGLIDHLGEDSAVIDVSGVGYQVFCSTRTLGCLTPGEVVSLVIETHVRDDHIHLYGFIEQSECAWFKLLTTVQGVGAKVALGILSALSGDELINAIIAADKATITRAPGVGSKLALRLLTELKEKVAKLALGPDIKFSNSGSDSCSNEIKTNFNNKTEAVSALVNLGYTSSHALSVVSEVAKKFDETIGLEELIRLALNDIGATVKD